MVQTNDVDKTMNPHEVAKKEAEETSEERAKRVASQWIKDDSTAPPFPPANAPADDQVGSCSFSIAFCLCSVYVGGWHRSRSVFLALLQPSSGLDKVEDLFIVVCLYDLQGEAATDTTAAAPAPVESEEPQTPSGGRPQQRHHHQPTPSPHTMLLLVFPAPAQSLLLQPEGTAVQTF